MDETIEIIIEEKVIDVIVEEKVIDVIVEEKVVDINASPIAIKGDTGEQGIQGIQGIQGEEGLSAYEVAVNNGFIGTEQEWLNSFKDRANHTGTQPISSIDNLQDSLNAKEPNIPQGTTGQYWRGDKTFQTLDKTAVGLSNVDNTSDISKPISTDTQSALDLKANLASPTFTGQLILPNNARINGIEHFYQTTKPITRGNGSALVIGDRWWKTDEGSEWFWNGTYWLSSQEYYLATPGTATFLYSITIPNGTTPLNLPVQSDIPLYFEDYFFTTWAVHLNTSSNHINGNYVVINLYYQGSPTSLNKSISTENLGGGQLRTSVNVNTWVNNINKDVLAQRLIVERFGTTQSCFFSSCLFFRLAKR